MRDGCIGDCLACGKCGDFLILDGFNANDQGFEPREGRGIAIDIGTTSVVLALIDLLSGAVMARHSFLNPQRAYGPDVISRISAANNGGLEAMRRVITEEITAGINALTAARGGGKARDIVIAGNTVMTHLLLGLTCESLGVSPFRPAHALEERYDLAGVLGMPGAADCPVRILPWLAAFVGGDITAGLLYVLPEGQERFMLVDLGTNGEMALYDRGRLIVTSTAAGPAFEGGASRGGASGVMDELARLVREGFVDETGLLACGSPGSFTQKEIRDLQLAKSAVRSGLEILLETAGLDYEALGAVYLAGGIGQAMDVDSAVTIGLLPRELRAKTRAAGNASLGGAARMLMAPKGAEADMEKLRAAEEEINLAAHPRFNELFMEHMYFEE